MYRRMSAWSRGLDRRRHEVVTDAAVFSVFAGVVAVFLPGWRVLIYVTLGVAFLLIFVSSLVVANTINRRRPRTFDLVDDPAAFGSPRLGSGVLMGASVLPGATLLISGLGYGVASGEHVVFGIPAIIGTLVFVGYSMRLAWIGPGVRLTPAGVLADGLNGSVLVPWTELDPDQPVTPGDNDFELRVGSRKINFEGVDTDFLREVIEHYVAHPDDRAAIGTADELTRLAIVLPAPPADDPARPAVLRPGVTRGVVYGYLLLAVAGIVVSTVGRPGWLGLVGGGLSTLSAAGLANSIRFGAIVRRFRS